MFDGVSGLIAAKAMERMNADAEREAVRRLQPGGGRILVIGFGPGIGIEYLLQTPVAHVVGVDPSGVMHRAASKRNRAALADGRLTLVKGEIATLEPCHGGFAGAIAVHTLQICRPFDPTARRLAAVLDPGARLVSITHRWAARKDYGEEQRFIDAVSNGLVAAGFREVSVGAAEAERGTDILIEAVR